AAAPGVPGLRDVRGARRRARARPRPRSRPRPLGSGPSASAGAAALAVRSARLSSLRPMSITVAVDANGADLGPSEVAEGAAEAAAHGVRFLLFGPAEQMR